MRLIDEQGRLFGRVSLVDLGLVLLILLITGPAAYFTWEIRTAAPYIRGVDPVETVISSNQNVPFVVRGKWFDSQTVVRMNKIPLIMLAANTQRLDLLIPTRKIRPGNYQLTVTNKRGLSTTWKEPIRLLSSPPKIREVLQRSRNERYLVVLLQGENFDEDSVIGVGNWSLQVTFKNPTRLEGRVSLPLTAKSGSYPVQVTNGYGQSDFRDNAITLSLPPAPGSQFTESSALAPAGQSMASSAPAPQPEVHPQQPPPKPVPVRVLCAFVEPDLPLKRKLIKEGATTYINNNTRPIAKILKIHGRISDPKSGRRLVIASVALACLQESPKRDVFLYGAGLRGYTPEGDPINIGKRLSFQFKSLDIEGTVLTDPVLLPGKMKKYLGR